MSTDIALSRRQLLRTVGTGIIGASVAPSIVNAVAPTVAGPWSPGETSGPDRLIRLNCNENTYGPSREVIAAIGRAAPLLARRGANEEVERLRTAIAARHRVPVSHVVVACGSSEILSAAANGQLQSGGKLVAASPTFEWFTKFPPRSGTEIVTVPLTREYEHDLDAMLARTGSDPTLVYVCNPNNPTGTLTPPKQLDAFVRALPATTRVVIDEAYHDYVSPSPGYSSWLDRSEVDPRVIVTRSFSKIHGLAGLRVGYAVAAPETL